MAHNNGQRVRWLPVVLAWSIPAAASGLQTYLRLSATNATTVGWVLADVVVTWGPWLLATPLLLRLAMRHRVRTASDGRAIATHLMLAAATSVLFHGWLALVGAALRSGAGSWWPEWSMRFETSIARTFVPYFLLYLAVVGIAHAVASAQDVRDRDARTAYLSRDLARAEVRALQSQIRPHFLFNALNTVAALVGSDAAAARHTLARLGDLLRASLVSRTDPWIDLGEEEALLNAYLEIERARFAERLHATVSIPRVLSTERVPFFVLQPLVENAVRHGVANTTRTVQIAVRAEATSHHLTLTVFDDGPGMAASDTTTSGVGLANLEDRLARLYDGRATLSSGDRPGGRGFGATVRLPRSRAPHC